MPEADPLLPRRPLLDGALLARALEGLAPRASSPAEVWRLLTQSYAVDLDAVARLIPIEEPEPMWLTARD